MSDPYVPNPIPVDGIELPEHLSALQERIAENTHDVWAMGRMKEGWVLGPERDDAAKTHPCLIPYDELPESEKDFDRMTAMGALKAILSLGYDIVKKPDAS